MPLKQITAPTARLLSVVQAKTYARVSASQTSEDSLFTDVIIPAAEAAAQNKIQCQVMAARYQLTLDSFPGPGVMGVSYVPWGRTYGLPENAIVVPIGNVLEVESIKYTDMAGVTQTLVAGTDYVAELTSNPARITPPFGQVWPPNVLPQVGAVVVTFKAGMLAPVSAVDATADTITLSGWKTLVVGDTLRLFSRDKAAAGDGKLPSPLVVDTDYYVQSVVSAGVYKVSASSGGAAIDLADTGGGDIFVCNDRPGGILSWAGLFASTLYDNRQQVTIDQRVTVAELSKDFADSLLDPYRMPLY